MSPTDWLIIAFVAGVLEIISPGFWMLWFAIAAAIVAACLGMEFIVSLNAQLLLFAALSLLFLVFTRPLVMRLFPSQMETKSNMAALVGEEGTTTTAITPLEYGQVKINGEIWTAFSSETIPVGTVIKILAVEGVKLKVAKN